MSNLGAVVLAAPVISHIMFTFKKFESLAAVSYFIANNDINGWFATNNYDINRDHGESFAGTKDLKTADDLMLHGWADGAARVRAAMIHAAGAVSDRPRCYNSVVGFAPNVPNYLAGCPLNMINEKRVRVPARVVDIVYNCVVGYNVKTSDIEKTAAKLFNVVAGLEKSGVRVNLWVMSAAYGGKSNMFAAAVKIKTASQPFNLLKMVYPVVHPSFLRRHMLGVQERSGIKIGAWKGHGNAITDDRKQKECATKMGIKSNNIFNYYMISGKTEKQIADMIK